MSDSSNSKWTRVAKSASALRGDRLSLVLTDDGWQATHKGKVHSIKAPPIPDALEEAITVADQTLSPVGWSGKEGSWIREGWAVAPHGSGWNVYKTSGEEKEKASVRDFTSADRARRWVEVRLDRTGTNLRGPKPRAGRKSNCKLPDVRVTENEKAAAMARLKELGLAYSQFVRASLQFAEEHLAGDYAHWKAEIRDGKAAFIKVPNPGASERSEEDLLSGSDARPDPEDYTDFYPDESPGLEEKPKVPVWATLGTGLAENAIAVAKGSKNSGS